MIRVRGQGTRANAARGGSGARPPGRRSPAEPPRPWEPGSARVFGARRARGGPGPGGSCRPHRVRGREGERCGQRRLRGPGGGGSALQHRGCTGQLARSFPPRSEPVQTSYWRRSRSGCRRLFRPLLVFGGRLRRSAGSWEAGAGLPGWGVPRAQPVPPPCRRPERPAGSAPGGATWRASRGPPTSAPRAGAARGAAVPAAGPGSTASSRAAAEAPGDSFFCGSVSPRIAGPGSLLPCRHFLFSSSPPFSASLLRSNNRYFCGRCRDRAGFFPPFFFSDLISFF